MVGSVIAIAGSLIKRNHRGGIGYISIFADWNQCINWQVAVTKMAEEDLLFLKANKIFFFQVAGTPGGEKELRQAYNISGIPRYLINQCEFYFLTGRMEKVNYR
jgi:hypothetical protein